MRQAPPAGGRGRAHRTRRRPTEQAVDANGTADGPAAAAVSASAVRPHLSFRRYTHTSARAWGPTWGERGYIRLEMGSDQCGAIAILFIIIMINTHMHLI